MATTSQNTRSKARSSGGARGDRSQSTTGAGRDSGTATVKLPFVTAEFRRTAVRVPGRDAVAAGVYSVREHLPSPGQLAFYGGLGALAALSLIEWPVAAAIGIGTVVAQRAGERASGSSQARSRPAAGRTTA